MRNSDLAHLDDCFLFKQKTAYDMRSSDWSSDVCSSDLGHLLIDMNQLATRCIDEANSLGRAEVVDWPRPEIAQDHAGDGLAARQGSDVEKLPGRQRVRMRHFAAVATDLVLVE